MRNISALLLAAASLSGCVFSTDPYAFEYDPGGEVLHTFPAGDDAATITVRREPAYVGSAASNELLVDGIEVVSLGAYDEHTFKLDPGQHIFGAQCWWIVNEQMVDVQPKRHYFFRIFSNMSDQCAIAPMSR
jgi:hypothetical protein